MRRMSEIETYAHAPLIAIPSLRFEELNHIEHTELTSFINQQIKDSIYDLCPIWRPSEIWKRFESLINSILHDLRTLVDDETCVIIRIGILHALQPKWLVLREIQESINSLGYTYYHVFADKKDLLLYYEQQAKELVKSVLNVINHIFDKDQYTDTCVAKGINIEDGTMGSIYSALFKTVYDDNTIEKCKTFLSSLKYLPSLLHDCVYSQTFYLFKNTHSLYRNVNSFQQHNDSIYHSRRRTFIQDYNNAINTHVRRNGIPNPDKRPMLLEEAFSDTLRKSYSEAYMLYDRCRGMLESRNDGRDYTEEGWLRTFFTQLFQSHYIGEQRDTEGNLTKVSIDERGNTSIEGKSGWERWMDFLTVVTLCKNYEDKPQDFLLVKCLEYLDKSHDVKSKLGRPKTTGCFLDFLICPTELHNDVLLVLKYYIEGKKGKDIITTFKAAVNLNWISVVPPLAVTKSEFGYNAGKTDYNDYKNGRKIIQTIDIMARQKELESNLLNRRNKDLV